MFNLPLIAFRVRQNQAVNFPKHELKEARMLHRVSELIRILWFIIVNGTVYRKALIRWVMTSRQLFCKTRWPSQTPSVPVCRCTVRAVYLLRHFARWQASSRWGDLRSLWRAVPRPPLHMTDLKNDQIKGRGREKDGQLAKDQSRPLSSKHTTLISRLTRKENEAGWSKSLYKTKPGFLRGVTVKLTCFKSCINAQTHHRHAK